MQFSKIIFMMALLVAGNLQAGEIYKSKDASGNIIYSGTAPTDGEYKIMGKTGSGKVSKAAQQKTQSAEDEVLKQGEQAQKDAASAAKTAEYDQQMQAYCQSLQQRLSVIQNNAYVKVQNAKGESKMLDDAGKQKEIKSLQGKISKDCH